MGREQVEFEPGRAVSALVWGDAPAELVNGPESFASFDEILDRTKTFNPTRSESSLRRGILHNAVERDDGTWVWRHQRQWKPRDEAQHPGRPAGWRSLRW